MIRSITIIAFLISSCYGFKIVKISDFKQLLRVSTKKSNRYKNINNYNNFDFFDNEFYDVNYNLNLNINKYVNKKKYEPKGINQEKYVNYLDNKDISLIFALGPAGTGKTLFACTYAINALKTKSISKIILTRPIVAVEDEEIGYLPGTLQHKMDPWTKPIFDIFLEYYKQYEIDNMIKESIIEISPLSYMRGRTFKNSIVICDEMQNSTPNQMLMLTTRIGEKSKMIITGDLLQSDRQINNGLSDIITKINNYKLFNSLDNIKIIEMSYNDIMRSDIVKEILKIYDN